MAPTSLHPKVNHTKTNHENDWNWREVKTVITGIWLMGKKAGKKGLSLKILQGVFPLPHYANLQDTRPTIQTRSLWLLCRALWFLKGQKKPGIAEQSKIRVRELFLMDKYAFLDGKTRLSSHHHKSSLCFLCSRWLRSLFVIKMHQRLVKLFQ